MNEKIMTGIKIVRTYNASTKEVDTEYSLNVSSGEGLDVAAFIQWRSTSKALENCHTAAVMHDDIRQIIEPLMASLLNPVADYEMSTWTHDDAMTIECIDNNSKTDVRIIIPASKFDDTFAAFFVEGVRTLFKATVIANRLTSIFSE